MGLSSRFLWLAAAITVLGVAGQWIGGSVMPRLWLYPAAVLALALIVEQQWARRVPITLRWQLPGLWHLGRSTEVALDIEHAAPRPLRLQWLLTPPPGFTGSDLWEPLQLAQGEVVSLGMVWTPQRLGIGPGPRPRARVLGRFGLGWWPRRVPDAEPLRVEPDTLHAGERHGGGSAGGLQARQKPGHGMELHGLRDYRGGDPIQHVDAKASLRRGRLIVREMLEDQRMDVVLVLDAGRAGMLRTGESQRLLHHVNLACRFAERIARLDDRLSVIVLQGGVHRSVTGLQGITGARRLRGVLKDLSAEARESSTVAGALEVRRVASQRALVIWLGDVAPGGGDALLEAARLLYPKHLPLFTQLLDEDVLAQSQAPAQHETDVYRAVAARQYLESQQASAARLRRAGCEVVTATPGALESALVARYLHLRGRHRVH